MIRMMITTHAGTITQVIPPADIAYYIAFAQRNCYRIELERI